VSPAEPAERPPTLSSAAWLACFPLVILAVTLALWLLPGALLGPGSSPAVTLLDDVVMAQERQAGRSGAYIPAPPCPERVPGEPAPFPGDCPAPWPELALDRTTLPCQVRVEVPAPDRFVATARCPDGAVWTATEAAGPHRASEPE